MVVKKTIRGAADIGTNTIGRGIPVAVSKFPSFTSQPVPALFTIRRITMRPQRPTFRAKPEVPSPRKRRGEAGVVLPEGLTPGHGPVSTASARPMRPGSHATQRPRLCYSFANPMQANTPQSTNDQAKSPYKQLKDIEREKREAFARCQRTGSQWNPWRRMEKETKP